jgi:predicted TPR repeat methyltransferase
VQSKLKLMFARVVRTRAALCAGAAGVFSFSAATADASTPVLCAASSTNERLAQLEVRLAQLEAQHVQTNVVEVPIIAAMGTSPGANRKLYDSWAVNYEKDVSNWGYNLPDKVAELLKAQFIASELANVPVLDAGAGDGLSGVALAKNGFLNIIGSDLSPEMLKLADRRGVYRKTQVVDLSQQLPFTQQFGLVTIVGTLTYLEPTSSCLSEAIRITVPGGLVCFTHRTDKVDAWLPMQEDLEHEGRWKRVCMTEPIPYLPGNAEYGTDVEVVIHIYRVV